MLFGILLVIWVNGVAATLGALSTLGRRNQDTIGDCFSGDYSLDLLIGLIWPIFWPCYAAHRFGVWLSEEGK